MKTPKKSKRNKTFVPTHVLDDPRVLNVLGKAATQIQKYDSKKKEAAAKLKALGDKAVTGVLAQDLDAKEAAIKAAKEARKEEKRRQFDNQIEINPKSKHTIVKPLSRSLNPIPDKDQDNMLIPGAGLPNPPGYVRPIKGKVTRLPDGSTMVYSGPEDADTYRKKHKETYDNFYKGPIGKIRKYLRKATKHTNKRVGRCCSRHSRTI